jgi:nucleoside-diphosphate-sugar epimerase
MPDFLILGAGFTAGRVARRLVEAGADVVITKLQQTEIAGARCLALDVNVAASLRDLGPHLSNGMVILHSIPSLSGTPELIDFLRRYRPQRIVYFSTTGVYGAAELVNEHTVPSPDTDKDKDRMEVETVLSDSPWSTTVLRSSAIYGPGRGVHWSARQGMFRPAPGGNRVVSWIHVDDLAEHALRAMQCDVTGAFPVQMRSLVRRWKWRSGLLLIIGIPFVAGDVQGQTNGRRVDGSAVRARLGIQLRYRSFREGVVACLDEEDARN